LKEKRAEHVSTKHLYIDLFYTVTLPNFHLNYLLQCAVLCLIIPCH